MQVVIDPRVFQKALVSESDNYVQRFVDFEQNKSYFCFIVTEKLKTQYSEFLTLQDNRSRSSLIITFIQHLLKRTSFKTSFLQIKEFDKKDFVQGHNCQMDELDTHLISIVKDRCEAKTETDIEPTVVLLLDCPSSGSKCSAEIRCLSDGRIRQSLENNLRAAKIVCADDSKTAIPVIDPRTMMNDQQHDAHFEQECALWLRNREEEVAEFARGVKRWGEEIDILLRKGNVFYIAECKLVRGKNAIENQRTALQQIKRRISKGSEANPSFCWLGLIFCNVSFDKEVVEIANSIKSDLKSQGLEIEFELIEVNMPKNWRDQPNWRLSSNDFKSQKI